MSSISIPASISHRAPAPSACSRSGRLRGRGSPAVPAPFLPRHRHWPVWFPDGICCHPRFFWQGWNRSRIWSRRSCSSPTIPKPPPPRFAAHPRETTRCCCASLATRQPWSRNRCPTLPCKRCRRLLPRLHPRRPPSPLRRLLLRLRDRCAPASPRPSTESHPHAMSGSFSSFRFSSESSPACWSWRFESPSSGFVFSPWDRRRTAASSGC